MLLFLRTKILSKSIPADLQAKIPAGDKTGTWSFHHSQCCICEHFFLLMWNFKRPYRRQSALCEHQKIEAVGYVKHHKPKKPKHLASSTYRKERSLVRNPKSKRPLKRLTILLCHPPTCTLWPFSQSMYLRSHTQPSSFAHWPAASATAGLCLKSGSLCFLLQPCDQQRPGKEHTLQLYSNISTPPWQMPQYPDYQLPYN